MKSLVKIEVPKGIRFDCSGCANCCIEWPVPITEKDYERISSLSVSGTRADFRTLRSQRMSLLGFTHTLEKQSNGSCQYLDGEKRCRLHTQFGAASKPSMCLLFPYTFTITPDTVLAGLSFASSAVLYNTGKLLSEQADTLQKQFEAFQSLFQVNSNLWQKLQLIDGLELSWQQFKELDGPMMEIVEQEKNSGVPRQMEAKLKDFSARVLMRLPDPNISERTPPLESRPKIVDQILLKHLERLYFPKELFKDQNYDLDARTLLQELVSAPPVVSFGQEQSSRPFADIISLKLGKLPDAMEELLDRFLYMRFFSKLYFGPGFHHLSLLSGLSHLRTLHVLLRIKIKESILQNPSQQEPSFEELAELVRALERRLTQLDLSSQSHSLLEVLLCSQERQERIKFLAE